MVTLATNSKGNKKKSAGRLVSPHAPNVIERLFKYNLWLQTLHS